MKLFASFVLFSVEHQHSSVGGAQIEYLDKAGPQLMFHF
jgi:hypothetical protein